MNKKRLDERGNRLRKLYGIAKPTFPVHIAYPGFDLWKNSSVILIGSIKVEMKVVCLITILDNSLSTLYA